MDAKAQPSLFGARLKEIRERRRLTQQELGELAHTGYNTIWRIEAGKLQAPSITVAARLAKALHASLDFLAGIYDEHVEHEEPPPPRRRPEEGSARAGAK